MVKTIIIIKVRKYVYKNNILYFLHKKKTQNIIKEYVTIIILTLLNHINVFGFVLMIKNIMMNTINVYLRVQNIIVKNMQIILLYNVKRNAIF